MSNKSHRNQNHLISINAHLKEMSSLEICDTHTHAQKRQSAWHQPAVRGQMRCVRAPCCQETDRKRRKQTLSNGDMTCSLGRKLKQTINGPWSLQCRGQVRTTAPRHPPPSHFTLALSHVGHLKTEDSTPATHFCKSLTPTELRLMGIRVSGESSKTDLGFK